MMYLNRVMFVENVDAPSWTMPQSGEDFVLSRNGDVIVLGADGNVREIHMASQIASVELLAPMSLRLAARLYKGADCAETHVKQHREGKQ